MQFGLKFQHKTWPFPDLTGPPKQSLRCPVLTKELIFLWTKRTLYQTVKCREDILKKNDFISTADIFIVCLQSTSEGTSDSDLFWIGYLKLRVWRVSRQTDSQGSKRSRPEDGLSERDSMTDEEKRLISSDWRETESPELADNTCSTPAGIEPW